MSNIPNSAIPHAWAHDEAEEDGGKTRSERRAPSLAKIAGIGAVAYLAYRAIR